MSTSDVEQDDQRAGGVPQAFRNALFWQWAPAMPRALPAGFITVLYALASAARKDGRLRFGGRGGKLIRVSAVASAVRADVKDVRRYIHAAIAAGVVAIYETPRKGAPIEYVILVSPDPDWAAAVRSLQASKRRRPAPWTDPNQGGTSPTVRNTNRGGTSPTVEGTYEKEPWGTYPPPTVGGRPPGSPPQTVGERPPHVPGFNQDTLQELADAGGQPQDVRALPREDHTERDTAAANTTEPDNLTGIDAFRHARANRPRRAAR